MSHIRKALAAAAAAAVAGLATALANGGTPSTQQGWVALIGGIVGLALAAGVATYAIPNTPPAPPARGDGGF